MQLKLCFAILHVAFVCDGHAYSRIHRSEFPEKLKQAMVLLPLVNALILTAHPTKTPGLNTLPDFGNYYAVYDLGEKYFAKVVSSYTGGSNNFMYYSSGITWNKCADGEGPNKYTFVHYRANKTVLRLDWSLTVVPGVDSIVVSDVTNDCMNPVQLKVITLWATTGSFGLDNRALKGSFIDHDLHMELRQGDDILLSIYYPYILNLSSTEFYINRLWLDSTAATFATSVLSKNKFMYIAGGNNPKAIYVGSMNFPNSSSTGFSSISNAPLTKQTENFPVYSDRDDHTLYYDIGISIASDLIYQFYSLTNGLFYSFDFNTFTTTYTSPLITYPTTGGDPAWYQYEFWSPIMHERLFYKNYIIDAGTKSGSRINLFLPTNLTTPYYSIQKNPTSLYGNYYWNNSVLYLTNNPDSISVTSSGFQPDPYQYVGYYQFFGKSIFPHCSNVSASSLFQDKFQKGMSPQPYFQLSFLNNSVNGIRYNNDNLQSTFVQAYNYTPKSDLGSNPVPGSTLWGIQSSINLEYLQSPAATINFDQSYTFNQNQTAYNTIVSNFVNMTGFVSGLYNVDLSGLNNSANNPFAPISTSTGNLTANNACKSQTIRGIPTSNGMSFAIDPLIFSNFTTTFTVSIHSNGYKCADPITKSIITITGVPFNDPYIQNANISQISFVNGTIMVVKMPNDLATTLNDYHSRYYAIKFTIVAQNCGPDVVKSYGSEIINATSSQLQIPIDPSLYNTTTTFRMVVNVVSPDGNCNFTSTMAPFTAGMNQKVIPNNWLSYYGYNNNGNLELNVTNAFIMSITSNYRNFAFSSLSASLLFQGCRNSETTINNYNNGIFNGTIEIPILSNFNGSKLYFSPSLQGSMGTCNFQSAPILSPFQLNGTAYIDPVLSNLTIPSSSISSPSSNLIQIDLSAAPSVTSNLKNYLSRGFAVSVAVNGTSFPIAGFKEIIEIYLSNFTNNMLSINSNSTQYSPCQRNLKLQFQIQSTQCDYMTYSTSTSYGNSVFGFIGNQVDGSLTPSFINGRTIRLPLSASFYNTFKNATLSLSAVLDANMCGKQTISANSSLLDATYLDFDISTEYYNVFAQYNVLMSGMADFCKFSISYGFNIGFLGTNSTILNIPKDNFQFLPGSKLTVFDPVYTSQIASFSNSYSISKYVMAEGCSVKFFESTSNVFSIPSDYFNSTTVFKLYVDAQIDDCLRTTTYSFNGGYPPTISNAFYNFGNIEILGSNFGTNTGECYRNKTILLNFNGISTKIQSSNVLSWVDNKIIIKGDFNVKSVTVQVGINPPVTSIVSIPYYAIETYMNNELTIRGFQQFSIQLNDTGFKPNDQWFIHPSNSLYSSFQVANGNIQTPMVLNLPRNKIAIGVLIYFYVGNNKVPGLIRITIKRTPVITGKTLAPSVQLLNEADYQFSFSLAEILGNSFVDNNEIINTYHLLPEHQALQFDATLIMISPIPGYFVSQYDIDANFNVVKSANGRLQLNGIQDAFTNISIANYSDIQQMSVRSLQLIWKYDNENTKLLKVGEFPLTMNMSLIDTKNAESVAKFSVVASVVCPVGLFPNVFGRRHNGKIRLCETCPDKSTCSSSGSVIPKGEIGYWEIESEGAYSYAECIPRDACLGTEVCNAGYSNILLI